jgi:3-methyladenine DNA glycosylase AlkD
VVGRHPHHDERHERQQVDREQAPGVGRAVREIGHATIVAKRPTNEPGSLPSTLPSMNVREAVVELRAVADPTRRPGMARVGITVDRALGVSVPNIRRIARRCGRDHELARGLWATRIHEARILATLVADPSAMSFDEMSAWAAEIDSWDVCDFAADLFADTPSATRAIRLWARSRHGYTKRCAFSMVARLAVKDKAAPDADFERWFPLIRRAATDDRNEVKKSVNWALRQIGKRNRALNARAIAEAEALLELDSRSARWIARDALRELRDPETVRRMRA